VAPAHQDPTDKTGKLAAVDIAPLKRLSRGVTLAAIKADPSFVGFALVRISRLSVMPVGDDEWAPIEREARG
jgi:predicted RNA-binding protein with PUA-like domain